VILYYREGESTARIADLLGISPAAARKRLERARRALRQGVLRHLGESLRPSRHRPGVIAAIVAALGGLPSSAQAMAAAAAGGGATGLGGALAGPASGAALGVTTSIARIARVARRLQVRRATALSYAAGAVALAAVLGIVLPLTRPALLWVWFTLYQAIDAVVRFVWLPRHGAPLTRAGNIRWAVVATLGLAAVAWANAKMAS
jgi:hypothetical protein